MAKPKTYRSDPYLSFIRNQPCALCGDKSDAHHVDTGGTGIKCADTRTVPLCRIHHSECHTIGKETFQRKHGIDFHSIVIQCLERYVCRSQGDEPDDFDWRIRGGGAGLLQ